jgi:hypothetical protein
MHVQKKQIDTLRYSKRVSWFPLTYTWLTKLFLFLDIFEHLTNQRTEVIQLALTFKSMSWQDASKQKKKNLRKESELRDALLSISADGEGG